MADFSTTLRSLSSPKFRRGASIGAFWILIGILAVQILQTYLVDGETQQSAYGDDWNDLGSYQPLDIMLVTETFMEVIISTLEMELHLPLTTPVMKWLLVTII